MTLVTINPVWEVQAAQQMHTCYVRALRLLIFNSYWRYPLGDTLGLHAVWLTYGLMHYLQILLTLKIAAAFSVWLPANLGRWCSQNFNVADRFSISVMAVTHPSHVKCWSHGRFSFFVWAFIHTCLSPNIAKIWLGKNITSAVIIWSQSVSFRLQ